ncbi:hypothetical protein [Microterricola pindariensis]|uniref:Nudix hydrolase domain-containing protein n=1 Tax=Microterricola pindariensis TaxID=478010 RepID=A0ABX5ATX6_9MICO|nr:hypothetical protein [Microterricola pindariensis]PPL17340.1 hypothetical protein GY24_11635 [Microterricola pindariensis]
MDALWSNALFCVLGAVATILIERIFGLGERFLSRSARRMRNKSRNKSLSRSSNLLTLGDEALYVVQFVPAGWEHANIEISMRPAYDLRSELQKAETLGLPLPLPAAELMRLVDSERSSYSTPGGRTDGQWNGAALATVQLAASNRTGDLETPVLRMETAESDHAASDVLTHEWERAYLAGAFDGLLDDGDLFQRPIPGMLGAIGLNATVITSDGYLVLAKRSRHASSGRNGYHISVNEGMLPSDAKWNGKVDPIAALLRGLEEELGVSHVERSAVRLHTVMYDVRRYQLGLLAHIDLSTSDAHLEWTAAAIRTRFNTAQAKDRFENRALEFVKWRLEDVREVIAQPDWLAHGRLNLALSAVSHFGERASSMLDDLLQAAKERGRQRTADEKSAR